MLFKTSRYSTWRFCERDSRDQEQGKKGQLGGGSRARGSCYHSRLFHISLDLSCRMFEEKVGRRSDLTFLETEWLGLDRSFVPDLSETAGLGVPNCFRGGQGSSARGKAPLQATGIAPTHSGANNASQLSPVPHQKGLILFQPQSKLLKARGFI